MKKKANISGSAFNAVSGTNWTHFTFFDKKKYFFKVLEIYTGITHKNSFKCIFILLLLECENLIFFSFLNIKKVFPCMCIWFVKGFLDYNQISKIRFIYTKIILHYCFVFSIFFSSLTCKCFYFNSNFVFI